MPSPLDYASTIGTNALDYFNRRRATNSATTALTGGVDNATQTVQSSGQRVQALYKPYVDAGNANAGMLDAGLQPGGGLADPYGKTFSFDQSNLANDPGYNFSLAEGNKAIDAARRAMGSRFSGGAVKESIAYNSGQANTHFNDAFARAKTTFDSNESTFRTNQTDRYNRLQAATQTGLDATGQAAGASQVTSQQVADLQTQKADAIAAGDLGKANALTNTISGITQGVNSLKLLDTLKGAAAPAAGGAQSAASLFAAAGGTGTTLGTAGTTGAIGTINPATGAFVAGSGAPAAAGAAAATPLTGYAGGGLVTSHGAMVGMLSNPITIAVAAGIVGVTALLKSQAHWESNTWVKGFQNKFDSNMDQINRQFQSAAQSGQLSKADATQIRGEVQAAMQTYEQKRQQFAQGGKDNAKVAGQALQTFDQWYGPNGSKMLGQMDQTIAQLSA